MKDQKKTKKQLIEEIEGLRQRINSLEGLKTSPSFPEMVEVALETTKQKLVEETLIQSEHRYQTLDETVPHGIQEMDPVGTILFANPAHHKIFGYSDQEIVGKSILDLQITDQAKTELSRYLAALVEEQPAPATYLAKNLTKDGRVIDVQVDWNYKRDHQGRVIGFIAIITDITERMQALAELRKTQENLERRIEERTSELLKTNEQLKQEIDGHKRAEDSLTKAYQRYLNIFDNIQEVYYEITLDGIILEISPSIKEISKYKREELIGKSYRDFYADPQERKKFLNMLLQHGKVKDYELLFKDKDGTHGFCSLTAKLIIDKQGNPEKIVGSLSDITSRKKLEAEQHENENRYRLLFNNVYDAVFVYQAEPDGTPGKFIEVNDVACKRYGYTKEEFLNLSVLDIRSPETREGVKNRIKKLFAEHKFSNEIIQMSKDGKKIYSEINSNLIELKGEPTVISIARDITERKKAETAFKRSEARMRRILNASLDRIRQVDKDLRIVWANEAAGVSINEQPEQIIGQTCYKLYHDSDTPCEGCPAVKAKETGQIERTVMYKPTVKGLTGERYWDVYCVPLKNEFGDIDSYIQVSKDITEEKKAEGLIHSLSQQLLQAQERERQMISYELHDRVAQDLSALKIGFDTLLDGQTALQEELHEKTNKLSNVINKAIQIVRNLSYDLRPPNLDEMNIAEALKIYIEEFSEISHMRIDFQTVGTRGLNLDSESKIHLYRLIQEGLNNTHKHAQASAAWVKLAFASENITLYIKDNGIGFDIKERESKLDHEKRLGLRSMRERVKLLGGRMKVKSRPGEGTKISITFPFKEKARDTENAHINR